MAEVKLEQTQELNKKIFDTSLFGRGKDLLEFKVFKKIYSKDEYTVWYFDDLKDLGNYQQIRNALKNLVKKGYIIKIKAYPVFWKRVKNKVVITSE